MPEEQPQQAQYTADDPFDIAGMEHLIEDLHTDWYMKDRVTQRQAIANAFRAALISPRQTLKWNSIVYQDLMHLPPEVDDADEFERVIRERKEKWDAFGQTTIDLVNQYGTDLELIDYGPNIIEKYMPGIWKNIRNAAIVAPYLEDLRQAAIKDIGQGGDGRWFRQEVLDQNIPGIGPKVTAFTWLLLAPKTSQLATIDIHMMNLMGKEGQSPKDYQQYLDFEKEIDNRKKGMGYENVPLGVFQWAAWDAWRTPGYHQDHTALRPVDPVDWRKIDWQPRPNKPKAVEAPPPEQESLFPVPQEQNNAWQMGWQQASHWSMIDY